MATPDLEHRRFESAAALDAWLDEHHQSVPGCWVQIAKKNTGVASVSYDELVEVLLCFGWIDGHTRRVDEVYYELRCTPRRSKSNWASSNVERVARMTAEGRMRPAG